MFKDKQEFLKYEYEKLRPQIMEAIDRVLSSGRYILGQELETFEKRFADRLGFKHCIGVGNGYDALYLSYRVLRAKKVYMVNELHVSTTNAAKAIKAILLTQPVNDSITVSVTGKKKDAPVHVEDACQTIGKNEKAINKGSLLVCFSFHPLKMLHCYGDGGAICTNNDKFDYELRMLRNHGRVGKTDIYYEGVNSRLDEIQAAILNVMLDNWEVVLELNRNNRE